MTSADVDPDGAEKFAYYEAAIATKSEGKLEKAAKLLEKSCVPPSIYKGHYRELFQIWRNFNRQDLKEKEYNRVIDRVKKMIRYDNEMIEEMLKYWSKMQNRKLPSNYFDRDRNLKMTDVKALISAAERVRNEPLKMEAVKISARFQKQ